MTTIEHRPTNTLKRPWNKGVLVGQKRPLLPKHVWSIRVRLEMSGSHLALFNLGIDSKLRACDLVRLRIDDVCSGNRVRDRATIVQQKTGRPVQFEITEQTRASIETLLAGREGSSVFLFESRIRRSEHISTRQYAQLVHRWVGEIGLDTSPASVKRRSFCLLRWEGSQRPTCRSRGNPAQQPRGGSAIGTGKHKLSRGSIFPKILRRLHREGGGGECGAGDTIMCRNQERREVMRSCVGVEDVATEHIAVLIVQDGRELHHAFEGGARRIETSNGRLRCR